MGGVDLIYIFITCKQIACNSLLYVHTEVVYHWNSAFLYVIGGILKCISLKLGIFKSLLSASDLKSYILLLTFRVIQSHYTLKWVLRLHRYSLCLSRCSALNRTVLSVSWTNGGDHGWHWQLSTTGPARCLSPSTFLPLLGIFSAKMWTIGLWSCRLGIRPV